MDRKARALALKLREHAKVGERALLLYPYGLEYPIAFQACLYAGLVAVPAYPPNPGRARQTLPRVLSIVRDASPHLILTTANLLEVCELARSETPRPQDIICLPTDVDTDTIDPGDWRPPPKLQEKLAFLQYTSGSTGDPKGVMISHANLMAHQRLAHRVFQRSEKDITVSWLPFYHDMGLIGSLLYPLYSGGTTMLMSPTYFLRHPLNWLHTISRYRAGVSTGPNFAYELCIQRSRAEDIETLDLSCWSSRSVARSLCARTPWLALPSASLPADSDRTRSSPASAWRRPP